MGGVRVKLRVSDLEPESRAPGSSQRLLRASTMTALFTHPGSWPLVCPQRHSPPPSEAGLAQAGLGCRVSSALTPPTLGPLPQWSRFLTLSWDSSPCLAASAALTPHIWKCCSTCQPWSPARGFRRCWLTQPLGEEEKALG